MCSFDLVYVRRRPGLVLHPLIYRPAKTNRRKLDTNGNSGGRADETDCGANLDL